MKGVFMKRNGVVRQVGSSLATPAARPALAVALTLGLLGTGQAAEPLQEGGNALRNGTIGYVLTNRYWSIYETEGGKTECPNGFNDGPREQFKKLYDDGKKHTLIEAQLKREGEQWHPTEGPESFAFKEAGGKIAYGVNLDGKVGPEDFDSPEGDKGIDNQMQRAIGCIGGYRTGGPNYHFENLFMQSYNDTRIVLELTGVDDLVNDDDVTVNTYRGSDTLLQDATGEGFIPGGTQRIDLRWGKDYVFKLKGKIVDGVLTTEPIDRIEFPWGSTFNTTGFQVFRGMQLKMKLTQEGTEGFIAGFVDVNAFRHHLNTHWSTHHQSYGQLSSPSLYKAMHRLADGYPDPKTGENTAISAAVKVKFIQVFVKHPTEERVTKN